MTRDISRPHSDTDIGIWQVIASAIRNTPRWGRNTIISAIVFVAVITAIGAAGLVGSELPDVRQQLLSVIMGHSGLILLGSAIFLHQFTQRPAHALGLLDRPLRLRTFRMHDLLIALPLIAFTAGCLLAASTAMLVPTMLTPEGRPFILFGTLYLIVAVVAGNTVRETTRFLYRHASDQALAASAAQGEAADARLTALQAQMNPHFLFNALNTVAALARTDPARAEATVENLAQVLRRTLDRSRRTIGTVAEEVEYLRAYLAIERERFGQRLRIVWDVDFGTYAVSIPPMTLQPLVENSLKYGIGGRLEGGVITITGRLENGHLLLTVRDSGPGFPANYREGTGLSNLRNRLSALYGAEGGLQVESAPGRTEVTVTIPVDQEED